MSNPVPEISASAMIDARISELGDWHGETLAEVRSVILAAAFSDLVRAAVALNLSAKGRQRQNRRKAEPPAGT